MASENFANFISDFWKLIFLKSQNLKSMLLKKPRLPKVII